MTSEYTVKQHLTNKAIQTIMKTKKNEQEGEKPHPSM